MIRDEETKRHLAREHSLPMFEEAMFDAVVGRRVLIYQPDSTEAVWRLVRVLRPGGRMLFHEHDTVTVENGRVSLPLHDRVRGWLRDMLAFEGADLHMGLPLPVRYSN